MPYQRIHRIFVKWMEFVQGMAHQRKLEDPAAMRDAQNKPKFKGCVSHMVQRQNTAAMKDVNLAYDGCMNRQKIRQCMHQGCTNDELQGWLCLSRGANKKRAIILVDVPAGPLTMLGFVQIMVEGGRQ
jgi:hypothetical protein